MAKPTTAPKKRIEENVKKPATPPKKGDKPKAVAVVTVKKEEKVEHAHTPLPVLKPAKPLDVATLRKRLLEVGVKWDKSDDADALKAKLDSALAEKSEEVEEDLLDDENDCYGKPDMRIATDDDCKRCPDFVKCGAAVAKVLDARKGLVAEAEDETDAAIEAEEVEEQDVPRTAAKGRESREAPAFLRPEDVTEMSDEITIMYDAAPSFDDDDSPKIREAVNFIYQHKPATMSEFRRLVVLGYLRKPKSQANETTVGLLQRLASGGFLRMKKA